MLLDSLFEPEELNQASFRGQVCGFLQQPAKPTHPKPPNPPHSSPSPNNQSNHNQPNLLPDHTNPRKKTNSSHRTNQSHQNHPIPPELSGSISCSHQLHPGAQSFPALLIAIVPPFDVFVPDHISHQMGKSLRFILFTPQSSQNCPSDSIVLRHREHL